MVFLGSAPHAVINICSIPGFKQWQQLSKSVYISIKNLKGCLDKRCSLEKKRPDGYNSNGKV